MLNIASVSVKRGRSLVLDNVSLTLEAGCTTAVVGESGAGKSTLIHAVLGLTAIDHGSISWQQRPVHECRPALVMQEPRAAFNPALSLRHSVLEPVSASGRTLVPDTLNRLCDRLELPLELLNRQPGEVSVGQVQRVGILRALITESPLVLFDEPLSALDAVTQKHTAKLIADLQSEHGFTALIVTHDLGYASAYADEIAVLRSGCIEEVTTADQFVTEPLTQYGCRLREAAIALGSLPS